MTHCLQLRLHLVDIDPQIWRRITVPSSLTLTELHAVIQGAMGWQDYHLHMFEIAEKRYEIPESDAVGPEPGVKDERDFKIGDLVKEGDAFSYEYDFGDGWRHAVHVEDTIPANDGSAIQCLAGERACPPEDCGGPFGYPDFLDALANPKHPEHENILAWAPGYEPELFSLSQANALIGAICALYRERRAGFVSS